MIQNAISMQMVSYKDRVFPLSFPIPHTQIPPAPSLLQPSAARQNPVFFIWKYANILLHSLMYKHVHAHTHAHGFTFSMVYNPY